jgi:CrcB protein
MKMALAILLGGGLGALGRYGVGLLALRSFGATFPYGTLAVNIVGSIIMGVLIELMALRWDPAPELRGFLLVGLLGGFTTFSGFSMETVLLLERGQVLAAGLYILLSVAVTIAGFAAAVMLTRQALI